MATNHFMLMMMFLKRTCHVKKMLLFVRLSNISCEHFLISKLSSQATDAKGRLFLGVRSKITTGCLLINVCKFLLSKEVENKAVMHIFMYQKMLIIIC